MTSTSTHPAARAVAQVRALLSEVRELSLFAMSREDTAAVVADLAGATAQLTELQTRVMEHAAAVEVEAESGAKSTADWLAGHTNVTPGAAHGVVRLLTGLNAYPPLREAMAEGRVLPEQARVILRTVDELPAEHRDTAVAELIRYAAEFDASKLRTLGRKILEVIAPEVADAHEAAILDKLEEEADTQTRMYLRETPEGTFEGRFTIPALAGAKLQKALWELAAPAHVRAVKGKGSYDHTVPTPKKLGTAFVEFLNKLVDTTLIVTVDHDTLFGQLEKAGWVETGQWLSPTALRQLACSAGIMPAILDGKGHVLDLGRKKRLHSTAQRTALTVERRTCEHPTCDVPAFRCQVHHITAWKDGGRTTVRLARLLCPRHHRLEHQKAPRRNPQNAEVRKSQPPARQPAPILRT